MESALGDPPDSGERKSAIATGVATSVLRTAISSAGRRNRTDVRKAAGMIVRDRSGARSGRLIDP
jgi:hypothetical protein